MTGSGAEPECHLKAGVIYDWRLDWQSRKSHNTWSVDRGSISQSEGSGGRGEKAVGRWKGGRRKEGYTLKWRKKLLSERYCSFLFSLMFLIIATSLLSVAVHSRVWSSSTQKSYYSHLGLHFSISITTSILCSMSLLRPHSPRLTHSAPQHSNTPMRILNLHFEPSANLTSWSRKTRADGPDPGERGVARSRQGERKRERESGRWER